MGLEDFTDIVTVFIKTADPQVVILILIFTFVLLRAVWMPHGYSPGTISLASLLIAIPVTFALSESDVATWGGRYFWGTVLKNGAVSVMAWYLVMPKVFEKWPKLLRDDPFKAEDPPHVPPVADRAAEDARKRVELKNLQGE